MTDAYGLDQGHIEAGEIDAHNRAQFFAYLLDTIKQAAEDRFEFNICLFEEDNKQFIYPGEQAELSLLQEMTETIRKELGILDPLMTYGYDKLAVVFKRTKKEVALKQIETIRRHFAEYEFSRSRRLTVSCGLANFPNDALNVDDLYACARRALRKVIDSGGNGVAAV